MPDLHKHWKRVPTPVRKPLVLVVGAGIIAVGVALLVLPGPGWAAIFLGFAILASEFVFAKKLRDQFVAKFKAGINRFRHRA
jgi:uncharacterized protein (TIGR02611 family)